MEEQKIINDEQGLVDEILKGDPESSCVAYHLFDYKILSNSIDSVTGSKIIYVT